MFKILINKEINSKRNNKRDWLCLLYICNRIRKLFIISIYTSKAKDYIAQIMATYTPKISHSAYHNINQTRTRTRTKNKTQNSINTQNVSTMTHT